MAQTPAAAASSHWHPSAAYLYTLHLDGPALAWEYLRRNSAYRRDWDQHLTTLDHRNAAGWHLRLFEDPELDARQAHFHWLHDPSILALVPCNEDAANDADSAFHFWSLPGRKRLAHDGKRLLLTSYLNGRALRIAIRNTLNDTSVDKG